ncbi:alpha/beta hydrolase [Serratia odorifera]|uniref:Hydrolase, alpha/beta domain protein n=2 Tax=Serratia odorifera TaxID=618 RepID=D4E7B1_SEROD|nr:alpha/beta hydrolase [Serratia odorifera]EFE93966.1 hydrolase, alpha/beta domain protein [Serratia odorifera DSM 4582]MBJ2067740.1 alpha/beta hydrolase [Serratia odorifera]PNK89152.1 alpha/beta hydrolase [Serratia odorifera]RII69818.1 alpha/beta hydrolase [Serratia odorifera]VDZ64056.1 Monoterpene epsilon-lactone hydrolase [Serratia odorifera]
MITQPTQQAVKEWSESVAGLAPVLTGQDTLTSMNEIRNAYSRMLAKNPAPVGVGFTQIDMGGIPGTLVTPDNLKTDAIVMYIHGGAYIVGEPAGYHGIGGNYASLLGARVYMPDYRLAPEYPFPTPVTDTVDAYEWLIEQGVDASNIVLVGESAGGAMVVTVMVAARNRGLPLPAGGVSISPWANLEHSGASMTNREGLDPLNTKAGLDLLARTFLGDALPNHPMASPVFADVTELPPILIQIGENELMLSDAIRLATHLSDNRVRVNLEVWPGMFHAWHFFSTLQPEALQAIESSVIFIKQALQNAAK